MMPILVKPEPTVRAVRSRLWKHRRIVERLEQWLLDRGASLDPPLGRPKGAKDVQPRKNRGPKVL